jgi:integrase
MTRPRGTGSIWQRGEVWWIQFYDQQGRRIREAAGHGRRVAEHALKLRLAEVGRSEFRGLAIEQYTVGDLVDALFVKRQGELKIKSSEWEDRRWNLHLKPFFQYMPARSVDSNVFSKYISKRLKEGASAASVNREIAVVRKAYRECEGMPLPKFPKRLKESAPRAGFLEDAQYADLMTEVAKVGTWLHAMTLLGADTGMRKGELLGLRVRMVDAHGHLLRLDTTKNEEPRTVPLSGEVLPLLEELIRGKGREDHVFTWPDGSHVKDFRATWEKVCCAAGLGSMVCPECEAPVAEDRACADCKKQWGAKKLRYAGLIFHDLRRSAVRNMTRSGVTDTVAMKISGHKTADVFRRYNITSEQDLHNAMKLVKKRSSGVSPEAKTFDKRPPTSATVATEIEKAVKNRRSTSATISATILPAEDDNSL